MDTRNLFKIIDLQHDEMIQTLKELVRIPSVTGNEKPAQEYIENLYSGLKINPERVYPDIESLRNHPAFVDTKRSYDDCFNIVATLQGDPSKASLILNGHSDVVSPEPEQSWRRGPFDPFLEGNRLYGRGAGDMKGGLIANFYALKAILDAGMLPGGTVSLQSVIDEEAGGAGGTLALLNQGYVADALLVTEPHNLNITISHVGIMYFKVKVTGRSAHSGLAHKGVNAIGKMYPIYNALETLARERGLAIKFPLYEQGSGQSCHLTVSSMIAGDWPGKVAGHAEINCRISFIPGETKQEIQKLIHDLISEVANQDEWLKENLPEIEWYGWQNEPWEQAEDHKFISSLRNVYTEVLGQTPHLIGRASGNDARFSGYFGMPGACIGPIAENIHGPDEWVDVDSLNKLIKVLAVFILDWCK